MRRRSGFALLTALWLMVAMAVVGLQFAVESRRARLAAMNSVLRSQARLSAQAALEITRARLDRYIREQALNGPVQQSSALADPWLVADSLYSRVETIGGIDVTITVRSLGAKMNINRASQAEFRNFLTGMEIDFSVADELSQTILDWRDTDNATRAGGAERDSYIHEGMLTLPRNNLFESVEELRYVYGMTEEIFEIVAPHLTVWGTGRINLNTAERAVLLSLTGMTESAVAQLLSLRYSGERLSNTNQLDSYLGGRDLPNNRTAVTVDELEIETLAATPDGQPILRAFGVVRRGTQISTLTDWRVE